MDVTKVKILKLRELFHRRTVSWLKAHRRLLQREVAFDTDALRFYSFTVIRVDPEQGVSGASRAALEPWIFLRRPMEGEKLIIRMFFASA